MIFWKNVAKELNVTSVHQVNKIPIVISTTYMNLHTSKFVRKAITKIMKMWFVECWLRMHLKISAIWKGNKYDTFFIQRRRKILRVDNRRMRKWTKWNFSSPIHWELFSFHSSLPSFSELFQLMNPSNWKFSSHSKSHPIHYFIGEKKTT